MIKNSSKKLDIFLLLAINQASGQNSAEPATVADQVQEFLDKFSKSLSSEESDALKHLHLEYLDESAEEQKHWREEIENSIGKDEPILDENIHFSHIDLAINAELSTSREIISASLPLSYKQDFSNTENEIIAKPRSPWIERNLRRAFVDQFVTLEDLETVSGFDRLSGAQIARLARFAGIREVALACMRIDEVESVSAFIRRFKTEDARAIATQISTSPQISDERAFFAENLVQSTMEMESEPSEMLDLLGIWLIGILLCDASTERVAYTTQRFPVAFAPKLAEIIEAQCRQTPADLQKEIGFEIEELVETILATNAKAV